MLQKRVIASVLKRGAVVVVLGAEAEVEPKPWHQPLQRSL